MEKLPIVKMITLKDKFGFSLEFEHIVERERELSIFIPYKNSIMHAHKEVIYNENFNDCEYAKTIQCEAYTSSIDFVKSKNGTYYPLKINKFGTIFSDKKKQIHSR